MPAAGTNFLARSQALKDANWSPEYTLTEDYALGMELKRKHWQGRYVCEYLAVGEAPEQVRNCFQQRSRWCKVRAPNAMSAHGSPNPVVVNLIAMEASQRGLL